MIRYFFKTDQTTQFSEIPEPKPGCWIDVSEASTKDLKFLASLIGLNVADLDACMDPYESPYIEWLEEEVLLVLRTPSRETPQFHTKLLSALFTNDYVITISPEKHPLIEWLLSTGFRGGTNEKIRFIAKIIQKTAKDYLLDLKLGYKEVLKLAGALSKVEKEDISSLKVHEETNTQYLSALTHLILVCEGLLSKKYHPLTEEEETRLSDTLGLFKQAETIGLLSLKTISSIRDSYQTLFANNLQKTIKLLTGLTIIVNIPHLVVGFFGMNVELPFERTPYGAIGIIASMLLLSILGVIYFRKKDWL